MATQDEGRRHGGGKKINQAAVPKGYMPMHKRLAMGLPVDGQHDPHGAGAPSTQNRIGNDRKGW